MVNWRRGSEFLQCSGIPQIYGWLEEGVHLIWNIEVTVHPMHSQLHSHLRVHLVWKYENVKMTLHSTPLGHKMSAPGGYILSQCVLCLTSWPNCALHLKTWPNSALGHEMTLPGGTSYLSVHFIWKMSSLQNLLLLHRGLFCERPMSVSEGQSQRKRAIQWRWKEVRRQRPGERKHDV